MLGSFNFRTDICDIETAGRKWKGWGELRWSMWEKHVGHEVLEPGYYQ